MLTFIIYLTTIVSAIHMLKSKTNMSITITSKIAQKLLSTVFVVLTFKKAPLAQEHIGIRHRYYSGSNGLIKVVQIRHREEPTVVPLV